LDFGALVGNLHEDFEERRMPDGLGVQRSASTIIDIAIDPKSRRIIGFCARKRYDFYVPSHV